MKDSQIDEVNRIKKEDQAAVDSLDYVGGSDGANDHIMNISPCTENVSYAAKGLLDANTGKWLGRSSKGNANTMANLKPSPKYINNFDAIQWDTPAEQRMT